VDSTLRGICDFALSVRFDDLPQVVVDKGTGILVDTLGCAVGGRECRAANIARAQAAGTVPGQPGAVIGSVARPELELAALWNTSMIRYLDYNDTLISGHASDMLGALVATSTVRRSSGPDLLAALVVSYEVAARLLEMLVERPTIDRSFSIAVGATAGLTRLLGMTPEATAHALSMTVVSGVPLRASRAGNLSDYKGVASAVSMQRAVSVARLAAAGLTGPSDPFEGRHGLTELLTGEATPLDIQPFGPWRILETRLKHWPVAYGIQPGIEVALELRKAVPASEVAKVTLGTAPFTWWECGSEPEKWDPHTRETADHSLPYAFARAYRVGDVDASAFEEASFRDHDTLDLMSRISVEPDERFGPRVPSITGVRAEVVDNKGDVHVATSVHPRGHYENPMSRDEISAKAQSLIQPALGAATGAAVEAAWLTPEAESFGTVLAAFIPPHEPLERSDEPVRPDPMER
jgi:2-methylcitrate dehydratase